MEGSFPGPVNIGSEEMVTINQMAEMIMKIAGKKLSIKHIAGPTGVRGRNSDNKLLRKELRWEPSQSLFDGLSKTYPWICGQLQAMSKEIQEDHCRPLEEDEATGHQDACSPIANTSARQSEFFNVGAYRCLIRTPPAV